MIIEGKRVASQIQQEIKDFLTNLEGRKPCLAVVLVGDHPASRIYIERKTRACKEVGIKSLQINLPETTTEADLLNHIKELNQDSTVDGILVQLPLPSQINPTRITEAILPEKDVDGFHPTNVGKILIGDKNVFFPCTPLGIRVLLERSNIEVSGKHVVIVGRSNIVGKPMAAMLMQNNPQGNATVTVVHSKTKNIADYTRLADIVIVAIGQPLFLKADMIKEGAAVIDVGINKVDDPSKSSGYKLVGDADFENIKNKCSYITPVPGGIGPMTIAMLLSNTLKSFRRRREIKST